MRGEAVLDQPNALSHDRTFKYVSATAYRCFGHDAWHQTFARADVFDWQRP